MFKKRERLTKAAFDRYWQSGKHFHGSLLQIVYTPNEQFHAAVVVGKKVNKHAVDRNRMRRRLYGVLYTSNHTTRLVGVFIVIVKPTAKSVPYKTIRHELEELVGRIQKSR